MVMNLGFWEGGIYNILFLFSLLECKNMLLLSWKINVQFVIHQRNCSTVFLKHRILAQENHFSIDFKKGFLSFIYVTGLDPQQFCLQKQKQAFVCKSLVGSGEAQLPLELKSEMCLSDVGVL